MIRMIVGLLGLIAELVCGALSHMLAGELKAWIKWSTQRLVHWAVGQLPESERERYREEWQSHLSEVPGDVGKCFAAVGFVLAARRMNSIINSEYSRAAFADASRRMFDVAFSATVLLIEVPLWLLIVLALGLSGMRPIISAEERIGLNGRRFKAYEFQTGNSRLGKFLIHTGLRFQPRMLNVLKGDMALVGPYALRVDDFEEVKMVPYFVERTQVRPGAAVILSWARPDPFREEQFYLQNRSLMLDLVMLSGQFGREIKSFFRRPSSPL